MNRKAKRSIAVVLIGIALVVGMYALMSARHDSGRLYPEYSSFRPDPKGTKAFFETLDRVPGVNSDRILKWSEFLKGDAYPTDMILALGALPNARGFDTKAYWENLEERAQGGATIVLAFRRQIEKTSYGEDDDDEEGNEESDELEGEESLEEDSEKEENLDEDTEEVDFESNQLRYVWIDEWLMEKGVSLGDLNDVEDWSLNDDHLLLATPVKEGMRQSMVVRSGLYFDLSEESEWNVTYELDGQPIVLDMEAGEGRIVLMADSYPFTNEALQADRASELFSWLLDDIERVSFFEGHLGVAYQDSIMSMARSYGFDVGLYFLIGGALIFVWKSSFSIIPKTTLQEMDEGAFELSSMNKGLSGLFERSIGKDKIARVAFEQWMSSPEAKQMPSSKKEKAHKILEAFEKSSRKREDLKRFYESMYHFKTYRKIKG